MAKSYKGITFQGFTFPDDKYRRIPVKLNQTMVNEYIPAIKSLNLPKGLGLLLIAMTHMEGFKKGTRSYRTNNPGNIGNGDNGRNVELPTLADGIKLQVAFIQSVAAGRKSAYPIGKVVNIPPFYSKEIAANPSYGLSPYVPGYRFLFNGELSGFVKIYSTGARATNVYLNTIVSYLADNGVTINADSKLQDIIK